MLRLTKTRRAILAEKFGDLGNLAVAALVFGQAVADDRFSLGLGCRWNRHVDAAHRGDVLVVGRGPMTTALFTLGGIAVIAFSITLLDWFARRKDRRSEHHPAA
jgi:hypothetical protein